jgi:hypothetical protein
MCSPMQAPDATATAGCVETVFKGIVMELEGGCGLFRGALAAGCLGARGCGPGSVLRRYVSAQSTRRSVGLEGWLHEWRTGAVLHPGAVGTVAQVLEAAKQSHSAAVSFGLLFTTASLLPNRIVKRSKVK